VDCNGGGLCNAVSVEGTTVCKDGTLVPKGVGVDCNVLREDGTMVSKLAAGEYMCVCLCVCMYVCMYVRMYVYSGVNITYVRYTKLNSMALVRERTIPTDRPPPVGEVSANFCG
jgi:hypothetical protein